MDHFEGLTLEKYVESYGCIKSSNISDFLALVCPVAAALQLAHSQTPKQIIHRDVKPANLLVRRDAKGWTVKLIDFSLALQRSVIRHTMSRPAVMTATAFGKDIAGTIGYAAPEQMGQRRAPIGPWTDVFGFGKTCCYALFKTPQPTGKQWKEVEGPLGELLSDCVAEVTNERPPDFGIVLERLNRIPSARIEAARQAEVARRTAQAEEERQRQEAEQQRRREAARAEEMRRREQELDARARALERDRANAEDERRREQERHRQETEELRRRAHAEAEAARQAREAEETRQIQAPFQPAMNPFGQMSPQERFVVGYLIGSCLVSAVPFLFWMIILASRGCR
jgi:serine/threonine protein kinase